MQSIMISVQPQWVEKILNGEKTIEIRKTKPKCELPAKVYIYCTKGGVKLAMKTPQTSFDDIKTDILNVKVIAEFTLNKIKEHKFNYVFENPETCEEELTYNFTTQEMKNAGFNYSWELDEFLDYYGKEKTLYAWRIENLVIYDTPKPLSNFGLTKAPQDWCYIKGVNNERKTNG